MNQSEDKEYQEYLKNQRDIKEYYEGLEIERVTQDLLDAKDKRDALIENISEFNPEALLAAGLEDALIGYRRHIAQRSLIHRLIQLLKNLLCILLQ